MDEGNLSAGGFAAVCGCVPVLGAGTWGALGVLRRTWIFAFALWCAFDSCARFAVRLCFPCLLYGASLLSAPASRRAFAFCARFAARLCFLRPLRGASLLSAPASRRTFTFRTRFAAHLHFPHPLRGAPLLPAPASRRTFASCTRFAAHLHFPCPLRGAPSLSAPASRLLLALRAPRKAALRPCLQGLCPCTPPGARRPWTLQSRSLTAWRGPGAGRCLPRTRSSATWPLRRTWATAAARRRDTAPPPQWESLPYYSRTPRTDSA